LKCPDHWGGYAIKPVYFEFWQGRPNRMHDRICYEVNGEHWSKFRLAP
jgi:pyridoxamine 5'-phosphate oxidase